MREVWAVCAVDANYEVSSAGRVRSILRFREIRDPRGFSYMRRYGGGILRPTLLATGYFQIQLSKDAGKKGAFVHRLVAMAFIPNPEGKLHVNHINGVKQDNRIENLEWATSGENTLHSFRVLGRQQHNKGRGRLVEFNGRAQTIKDWSAETGLPVTMIHCRLCSGWSVERTLTTAPIRRTHEARELERLAEAAR